MTLKNIDNIIINFLEDRISKEESIILKNWLKEEKNKLYFEQFIEVNYLINSSSSFDSSSSLKELMCEVNSKKLISFSSYFKYAAAVLISVLGTIYFLLEYNQEAKEKNHLNASQDVVLELASGEHLTLSEAKNQNIFDASGMIVTTQKGKKLDYQKEKFNKTENLDYNRLIVPHGKTFQLVLSDGTKVHLNAGTTLRYPVHFTQGMDRLVYVNGEAYFDVISDDEHPFIVKAKDINIRVMGTQFNISNYPEDDEIKVVLKEGSVTVYEGVGEYDESTSLNLLPSELASWNRKVKKMRISEVDVDIYTSWMSGVSIFKHMKFKDIILKLERTYNVSIKNNNKSLDSETFTARFENETLEHVLESLNRNYGIKYKIHNNVVEIN